MDTTKEISGIEKLKELLSAKITVLDKYPLNIVAYFEIFLLVIIIQRNHFDGKPSSQIGTEN